MKHLRQEGSTLNQFLFARFWSLLLICICEVLPACGDDTTSFEELNRPFMALQRLTHGGLCGSIIVVDGNRDLRVDFGCESFYDLRKVGRATAEQAATLRDALEGLPESGVTSSCVDFQIGSGVRYDIYHGTATGLADWAVCSPEVDGELALPWEPIIKLFDALQE